MQKDFLKFLRNNLLINDYVTDDQKDGVEQYQDDSEIPYSGKSSRSGQYGSSVGLT